MAMKSSPSTRGWAGPGGLRLLASCVIALVLERGAAAQSAGPAVGTQPPRGTFTVAAIGASQSVDTVHLNPDVGGDGPNRLGVGVQASAQLWVGRVIAGIEASTASLSWGDSRPRSLGPAREFSLRENVGLLIGGIGWPRQSAVVVLKAGVGLRSGSVEAGASPLVVETAQRNRLVVGAGVDLAMAGARAVRPVVTFRYIRAQRSEQEQSIGIGSDTVRIGIGIDIGRR